MDNETLCAAVSIMKALPDNAASSAAAAEASALRAETAADSVTVATVAEIKEYLGIAD